MPAPLPDGRQQSPFGRIAVIGLGLIGSSVARAVRVALPEAKLSGFDADADVRAKARSLGLTDRIDDSASAAVADAELVVLCVPVGAMGAVARDFAAVLPTDAIVTDVGSCKASVVEALAAALPDATVVPAHPVAGTERSGPEAGFATLFQHRWCIVTPPAVTDPAAVERVCAFWRALGAEVEVMDPAHHDRVLAVTSHLPHLIAYTIVGTASELEEVTRSEVIKYSAGGFRDFTRIAASDPTMWRDVFLSNKEAVLDMLQRFTEDLTELQRAIRRDEGDRLFDTFTRTRAIRRSIIEQGQDDARADFGRSPHHGSEAAEETGEAGRAQRS
jgi:cyclohexadieny/prephenate dehydrogenase